MVVSATCCIAARGQPNLYVEWLTPTDFRNTRRSAAVRNQKESSSVGQRDANFNRRTSPRLRADVELSFDGFQPFFHACQAKPDSLGCLDVESDAKVLDRQLDVIGPAAYHYLDSFGAAVFDRVL